MIIRKICAALLKIKNDKLLHFIIGDLIASLVMLVWLVPALRPHLLGVMLLAVVVATACDIYKEIKLDASVDAWDVVATMLGGIAGALQFYVAYLVTLKACAL